MSPRLKHVHLADEAVLVNTLALAALGLLGPHLLHVLEDHVAVSVKCLDTGKQLAVVTAGDQDLGVRTGGGLEEGQRSGSELVLLNESNLIFPAMQETILVFYSFPSPSNDLRSLHKNVLGCQSRKVSEMRASWTTPLICPGRNRGVAITQIEDSHEKGWRAKI